MTPQTVKQ